MATKYGNQKRIAIKNPDYVLCPNCGNEQHIPALLNSRACNKCGNRVVRLSKEE